VLFVVVAVLFVVVAVLFVVVVVLVVVVAPAIVVVGVVAVCVSRNMAYTVTLLGTLGMTFTGSKAIATRSDCENLMDDGLVVNVGFC
jgi:hypothetical protein